LKNVPTWDEISATLKSRLDYATATLERARHTYNVFTGTCCSSNGGDAESIIKAGIRTVGILYEDGQISRSKLARLRSLAFRMLEYVQTGTISWKRVPPYGQRYANEEHEYLITMFVQNEQRTQNHADSIISRDRCIIRIFLIYAEEHKISIQEITPSEMIDFLKYMQGRRPAGIDSTVSALKHFYLFLIDMKLSDDHILPALKPWGHPRHKIYGLLTQDEKRQIIEAIDLTTETGKRDKAIFLLAMDCGIRSSDICTLKLSEIDWHNAAINIIQKKTKKQISVPFSVDTGNALADYIMNARGQSDLPYAFVKKSFVDSPMTSSLLCLRLKQLMQEAGIQHPSSDKISMHTFRRSLGTSLIDSGENLELVAQVLGHKDVEATKVYISTSEKLLRMCPLEMPARRNGGAC
jgi:site-specific recombinase XerD